MIDFGYLIGQLAFIIVVSAVLFGVYYLIKKPTNKTQPFIIIFVSFAVIWVSLSIYIKNFLNTKTTDNKVVAEEKTQEYINNSVQCVPGIIFKESLHPEDDLMILAKSSVNCDTNTLHLSSKVFILSNDFYNGKEIDWEKLFNSYKITTKECSNEDIKLGYLKSSILMYEKHYKNSDTELFQKYIEKLNIHFSYEVIFGDYYQNGESKEAKVIAKTDIDTPSHCNKKWLLEFIETQKKTNN